MESPKSRKEKTTATGLLRRVWQIRKQLIIEPLLLFWMLPGFLLSITVQNLLLEKACRVNLGYDPQICLKMLDKEVFGIDCASQNVFEIIGNETISFLMNDTISMDLNQTVCKAESHTQKKIANINEIRGPMSSIFPLIVILFAGGWSDRKGLRKPCMIFPMFGDLIAMISLLITSIYMDIIPMEFGAIIEDIVPSMLGGPTLMTMGIYSYLTDITEEKDRTLRYGILIAYINTIVCVGNLVSGKLHRQLGYIKMLILALCIEFVGILYLIFFIPEIQRKKKSEMKDNVNQAFDSNGKPILTLEIDEKKSALHDVKPPTRKKNFLVDFFDPTAAYECVEIVIKKRAHNLRSYIILLIILQILIIAPSIGEGSYHFPYQLRQLKWNGEMRSYFATYSAALDIIGPFVMTAGIIKLFKLNDALGGFIASLGAVVSRIIVVFAKDSVLYYIAKTVNMFALFKAIAVKSIISGFVEPEELARTFSVLGITEALSGIIAPLLYSEVFYSTIDSFPAAFYLFSEIFYVPTLFLFLATYFYLKKQAKKKTNGTDEIGIDNPAMDEIESTRI